MKQGKTERLVEQTGRYYTDLIWMMLPLLCMAVYYYGPRPVVLCLVAVITAIILNNRRNFQKEHALKANA